MSNELVPLPDGPGGSLPAMGAGDVVEAWLEGRCQNTQRAYVRDIRHFAKFIKAPSPADATETLLSVGQAGANRLVLAYRAYMTRLDLSSATIARRLAAIRSMVKVARLIGRVTWSIDVEGHKIEPRMDRRGPSRAAIQQLWAAALAAGEAPRARRDRAIVSILSTTGLRRGELAALELADILPEPIRPEALAVSGKGRREKEPVTLPELARAALVEYLHDRGHEAGPLFYGRLPLPHGPDPRVRPAISGETIRRIIRRLALAAGLPRSGPTGCAIRERPCFLTLAMTSARFADGPATRPWIWSSGMTTNARTWPASCLETWLAGSLSHLPRTP